jgi:phage shock protein PspC (stress-responsive transcriptional regulator)
MQYKSIKGFTGMGQLGILFVFIGGGLVLAAVLQYFIAITIVPEGTPMSSMADEMMKALNKPANVNTARLLQVLGTFCMLFIPALMFSWSAMERILLAWV